MEDTLTTDNKDKFHLEESQQSKDTTMTNPASLEELRPIKEDDVRTPIIWNADRTRSVKSTSPVS